MSNMYNTIAELCNMAGITGYKLCKDIGIQPSTLTDLKMGRKTGLSAKNASKIAEYFGVSVEYLLTGEQKENAPDVISDTERDLLDAFRKTDANTRSAILTLLRAAESDR